MQTNPSEPMEPSEQFCPNPACCARGQKGQGNIAIHDRKRQRYRCKRCKQTGHARDEERCSTGCVHQLRNTKGKVACWESGEFQKVCMGLLRKSCVHGEAGQLPKSSSRMMTSTIRQTIPKMATSKKRNSSPVAHTEGRAGSPLLRAGRRSL